MLFTLSFEKSREILAQTRGSTKARGSMPLISSLRADGLPCAAFKNLGVPHASFHDRPVVLEVLQGKHLLARCLTTKVHPLEQLTLSQPPALLPNDRIGGTLWQVAGKSALSR